MSAQQAVTWSYNDYFMRNTFSMGNRLVHTGEKPEWFDGSMERPLPAGIKHWENHAQMMRDNGYKQAECTCWVKFVGEGEQVHQCPLNQKQINWMKAAYRTPL